MATKASDLQPLQITVGVQPDTDRTPFSTPHYAFSDKIRSFRGIMQKIGGWRNFPFSNGAVIEGIARSLYSAFIDNGAKSLIGTNDKLYSLIGQDLTNITPLNTDTTAIANSLATDFGTLASNPIATHINSTTITVIDANAPKYANGDDYTLSGATAVGGVGTGALNAVHVIRSTTATTVSFITATTATSTATGGGSVVRKTGRMTVTAAAHGMANGDRVLIQGAADTGGILAVDINLEFIIRNITTNTFDIFTTGTATSSVSGGGGASTTYQSEIPTGAVDVSFGQGYGGGKYGAGLYGVSKTFVNGLVYPRIWFFDRFADTALMTPGNQTGIYQWQGDTAAAPVLVENAPTEVNYIFVSDNILVTLGAGGTLNRIFSSDQGDPTNWTGSSTNQVFDDDVEGAGQLITHISANGVNLIFTPTQTYLFSYIGIPDIWNIQLLDNSIGIIGPMARVSVNNIAYWMGPENFYRWTGGNVEIVPANTQDQCTMLNYVFQNINSAQAYKSFGWYNRIFNEIWFHYPSAGSSECDRVARVSLSDNSWVPDTFDRSCAEYPSNIFGNPRLISEEGTFYVHEFGTDADGEAMAWQLESNLRFNGKKNGLISGFLPDQIMQDGATARLRTWLYPQAPRTMFDETFTFPDAMNNSGQIPVQVGGRFWKYDWAGAALGQEFIMGQWMEFIQPGADN